MKWLLWLVPALPFAGFALLMVAGGRLTRRGQATVGVGSVGAAAFVALLVAYDMIVGPPAESTFRETLWTWFSVGDLRFEITLMVDPLAVIMMLVITVVGFFIHLYSAAHMAGEEGHRRFFAAMNLFVGSMLVLVLADNLLLLYLGWEGVGLCSYLLIGFWYRERANGAAARKAFIVTRVGDAALLIGIILLATQLGTLRIYDLLGRALSWERGSAVAVAAAALVLAGALGKSAQLPLQTWLPDAMAGPSPVSALIHAATMVTAGVYLIARTNVLFTQAPQVATAVAVIGALTLLYAGCSALVQTDIKRVLAYSTISQIGYMFLALGVGAWGAAIFHLMTHAFFKALLFLSAGVVIEAMGGEHDMFRMGGLRRRLPLTFWSFTIGAASLAALPLVTAGYYSKELIIAGALTGPRGSGWLWAAAFVGAGLTALYIFRAVFLVFFGAPQQAPRRGALPLERVPLLALALLSVVGGFVEVPAALGGFHGFSEFMAGSLPAAAEGHGGWLGVASEILAPEVALAGLALAWVLYRRGAAGARAPFEGAVPRAVGAFWRAGWGFDWLYDRLFVRPYVWAAAAARSDPAEPLVDGLVWVSRSGWAALSRTQSGLVRTSAAAVGVGIALLLAIVVLT